jgi:hypothetical protein
MGPDKAADSLLLKGAKSCSCPVDCKMCPVICPDEDHGENKRKRPYAPSQLNDNRWLRTVWAKSRDQLRSANTRHAVLRNDMRNDMAVSTATIASMQDEKKQLEQTFRQEQFSLNKKYDELNANYERKCQEVYAKDTDISRMDRHIRDMNCHLQNTRTTISALQQTAMASERGQMHSVAQTYHGPTVAQAQNLVRVEWALNSSHQNLRESGAKVDEMTAAGVRKDDEIIVLRRLNEELRATVFKKTKTIEEQEALARMENCKLVTSELNVRSFTTALKTSKDTVIELHNRIHQMSN